MARLGVAAICAVMVTAQAFAQDNPTVIGHIAIVDIDTILQKSSAAVSIREQLDEISTNFQERIDQEEEEIRNQERDLQQQQALLAPEVLRERRQEWQERAASLQRRVAAARRALGETANAASRLVQNILIEEVGKLAVERGISIVLPSSQTLFAADALIITDEAMARLNERLPTVPIEIKDSNPEPEPDAAPR